MVKEAEANAENDKQEREKVEAKNNADSLIYQTEKTLKEAGDKVNAADKQQIEAAIADLKQALSSDNIADIKAKTEALQQAAYKIAEEMYKQQGAQPGGDASGNANASGSGGSSGGANTSGTADDVDYEVVNDESGK